MSVLDEVKSTLQTKQGKVIAALAAGGLVWLWWNRGRAGAPATDDPGTVTTTDRVPGAVTGGNATVDGGRPETNQVWLDRALSVLTNPPYNYEAGAVFNALRLALDGSPITAAQQAIVSKAISVVGSPPEGMPPTNVTAPDSGGGTGDGPIYGNVGAHEYVEAAFAKWRAQYPNSGIDWDWGHFESSNPGVSANIHWVKDPGGRYFINAATYRLK